MPSLEAAVVSASSASIKSPDIYETDDETSIAHLLEVSRIVLLQAVDLINKSLASDEQLSVQSKYIPGSTIGVCLLRNYFRNID